MSVLVVSSVRDNKVVAEVRPRTSVRPMLSTLSAGGTFEAMALAEQALYDCIKLLPLLAAGYSETLQVCARFANEASAIVAICSNYQDRLAIDSRAVADPDVDSLQAFSSQHFFAWDVTKNPTGTEVSRWKAEVEKFSNYYQDQVSTLRLNVQQLAQQSNKANELLNTIKLMLNERTEDVYQSVK